MLLPNMRVCAKERRDAHIGDPHARHGRVAHCIRFIPALRAVSPTASNFLKAPNLRSHAKAISANFPTLTKLVTIEPNPNAVNNDNQLSKIHTFFIQTILTRKIPLAKTANISFIIAQHK